MEVDFALFLNYHPWLIVRGPKASLPTALFRQAAALVSMELAGGLQEDLSVFMEAGNLSEDLATSFCHHQLHLSSVLDGIWALLPLPVVSWEDCCCLMACWIRWRVRSTRQVGGDCSHLQTSWARRVAQAFLKPSRWTWASWTSHF